MSRKSRDFFRFSNIDFNRHGRSLLWFTSHDPRRANEEELLIGVYSSMEKAEEAKARIGLVKGFKDDPSGFEICPYK